MKHFYLYKYSQIQYYIIDKKQLTKDEQQDNRLIFYVKISIYISNNNKFN